ncbi:MAG: response regulator, partial [Myxococcota bacterium]
MRGETTASILIVEDDPGLRGLLSEYLQARGFEVGTEGRGDRAVERIAQSKPDVVILDLMLPGLDGFEICREARRSYHGGILMLTASKAAADQMLGLELGADDYVLKPVDPRILLARLRALLRRLQPTAGPGAQVQQIRVGALVACR